LLHKIGESEYHWRGVFFQFEIKSFFLPHKHGIQDDAVTVWAYRRVLFFHLTLFGQYNRLTITFARSNNFSGVFINPMQLLNYCGLQSVYILKFIESSTQSLELLFADGWSA